MRLRSKSIVLALSLMGLCGEILAQTDAPVQAPAAAEAAPVMKQSPPPPAPSTAAPGKQPPAGSQPATTGKGAKQSGSKKPLPPMPPNGTSPGQMPPQKPAWEQFPLPNKKLLLDFTEASPDMIFSLFARTSGITIIKEPGFKTPLTISSARSLGLKDSFELLNPVLQMQGYEFQKRGKFLVVGKIQPPPPPPMGMPPPPPPKPITKVYPIKYASAKEVARVVTEVFGSAGSGGSDPTQGQSQVMMRFGGFPPGMPQMGGAPSGGQKTLKATAEEYSNSVIVTALETEHKDVKELIDKLDKASDSPLESEIFKLTSVPADQAVDAVQEVLSANAPLGRGAGKANQSQNQDYYYYNPFRQQKDKTNNQTVISIKQTNSILVVASKENMVLVKNLIKNLDVAADYTGTTSVIHLENAKATDVADLLNKAFTKQNNNNDNPFFFFFDGQSQDKKTDVQPTSMNRDTSSISAI